MKHTLSVAAMALLFGVGVAAAQQDSSMYQGQLDHLDRDDSGGVSQTEYVTFMTEAFARLDTNGDGYLTQNDVSSILSADQFAATDANGDGSVSRQEFMNQVTTDFQTADRSGDGHLK